MRTTSKAAIDWDLRFGPQAEHLEELAEDGNIPAALETRPELSPFLQSVKEAFWMLNHGRLTNGGGMAAFHLGPIQVTEALAIADAYGFDPVYFLRVIQPADTLYRQQITARIANGHR